MIRKLIFMLSTPIWASSAIAAIFLDEWFPAKYFKDGKYTRFLLNYRKFKLWCKIED